MGPLAQKARELTALVQKYEDAKASEVVALEESNKALKKRAAELESALREKDAVIAGLKKDAERLQGEILEAKKARPIVEERAPESPREAKPIGAGMSKEAITAMAMVAVIGDSNRRK